MNILSTSDIAKVLEAIVSANLFDSRDVLLGGIERKLVAALPKINIPSAQITTDLRVLNAIPRPKNGDAPLETWLATAAHLAASPAEALVFKEVRARCREALDKMGGQSQLPGAAPDPIHNAVLAAAVQLSQVKPEGVKYWRVLRERSAVYASEPLEQQAGGLAYHDWRKVQPLLTARLETPSIERVALVGRGGIGKTFLMKALLREHDRGQALPIYLTGDDIRSISDDTLAAALECAQLEADISGIAYLLLIDAFEASADSIASLRDHLATLDRGAAALRVNIVLAARATTWAQLAASGPGAKNWTRIELSEWPETLVRDEINASQRPRITGDLIQILRTPLLLDLFLRTFGLTQEIPEGLQTRHGILSAYWRQRVLPDDDPSSPHHSEALLLCAEEEARGVAAHRVPQGASKDAYDKLASEGVFIIRDGAYVFRHPLLRDFAMMRWAYDGAGTAGDVSLKLSSVQRRLAQFGALRATIETACEPADPSTMIQPSIGLVEILQALARNAEGVLLIAADVVGELDDPSSLRIEALFDAIAPDDLAGAFAERTLQAAKLAQNWGFLRLLAALPDAARWAESKPWITPKFLQEAAGFVEITWRKVSEGGEEGEQPRASCQAIARRLMTWSEAPRLEGALLEKDAWLLQFLMQTVAQIEPTNATVEWLITHATRSWRTSFAVALSLPLLATRARLTGTAVDEERVARLYMAAARLRRDERGALVRLSSAMLSQWDYDWIECALLGGERRGTKELVLLDWSPSHFLPIAFGLLAGRVIESDPRWNRGSGDTRPEAEPHLEIEAESRAGVVTETEDLKALWSQWLAEGRSRMPAEALSLEEQLQPLCEPKQSIEEVSGGLVFDSAAVVRQGRHLPIEGTLAQALKARLQNAVESKGDVTVEAFAGAALSSCSTAARAVLLDVLTISAAQGHAGHARIIDAILNDPRVYHDGGCTFFLWRAIKDRWAALDQGARTKVLANIAEVARSPFVNGRYAVAPLLCAVPEGDRPEELQPFVKLYTVQGANPEPSPPERRFLTVESGPVKDDDLFRLVAPRSDLLDPACLETWRSIPVEIRGTGQGPAEIDAGLRRASGDPQRGLPSGRRRRRAELVDPLQCRNLVQGDHRIT
jgi:hypothetical protein